MHGRHLKVLAALFLSLVVGLAEPVSGQADSGGPVALQPEKSPTTAGFLEAFTLPTLGYAYAGAWARGLPPALGQILGVALALEQQYCLCIFEEPPPCTGQCIVGIALAVGSRIWAVIDASSTVKRRQASRTPVSSFTVAPSFVGGGVGVTIAVPIGKWR